MLEKNVYSVSLHRMFYISSFCSKVWFKSNVALLIFCLVIHPLLKVGNCLLLLLYISALLTMPKPLTVWITRICGKF